MEGFPVGGSAAARDRGESYRNAGENQGPKIWLHGGETG